MTTSAPFSSAVRSAPRTRLASTRSGRLARPAFCAQAPRNSAPPAAGTKRLRTSSALAKRRPESLRKSIYRYELATERGRCLYLSAFVGLISLRGRPRGIDRLAPAQREAIDAAVEAYRDDESAGSVTGCLRHAPGELVPPLPRGSVVRHAAPGHQRRSPVQDCAGASRPT